MISVHHTMGHGVDSSHIRQIAYGRFGLPGGFLPAGGRPGLKYGISRKIREIWQAQLRVVRWRCVMCRNAARAAMHGAEWRATRLRICVCVCVCVEIKRCIQPS